MKSLENLAEFLNETEISSEAARIILDIALYDVKNGRSSRGGDHYIVATADHKFVEVPVLKLPTSPPSLWSDKSARGGRNPFEFIKHYYAEWLDSGFARVHLRTLDMPLYYAYTMWERNQVTGSERLPPKPLLPSRF